MECAASIAEPMLPGCQLTEVAGSLWHGFVKQLEHYASRWLRVDSNVELLHNGVVRYIVERFSSAKLTNTLALRSGVKILVRQG